MAYDREMSMDYGNFTFTQKDKNIHITATSTNLVIAVIVNNIYQSIYIYQYIMLMIG